jgi:hypothetical protein
MCGDVSKTPFTENIARILLFQQYALTIKCAWEAALKHPELPGRFIISFQHFNQATSCF